MMDFAAKVSDCALDGIRDGSAEVILDRNFYSGGDALAGLFSHRVGELTEQNDGVVFDVACTIVLAKTRPRQFV
jgi:hypothetical protein